MTTKTLEYKTYLCATIIDYKDTEYYSIVDDKIILNDCNLLIPNKNIKYIIPNIFLNEVLKSLEKYKYTHTKLIKNNFVVYNININECIISFYTYILNNNKLYYITDFITNQSKIITKLNYNIEDIKLYFNKCLDYNKLNLINMKYVILDNLIINFKL